MKKALILIISLTLLGCSPGPINDQETNTSSNVPSPTPSFSPTSNSPSLSEQDNVNDNTEIPQGDKVYFGSFEVNHSFDAIGTPPTYIRIIENDTVITWGIEAGLVANTENNPYGGTFTGVMTEIAENIYAVDGDFFYLNYEGQYDNLVSEDIDFYIILREDTLYGVFEPMSISELKEYIPLDVYIYGGDK